MSPIALEHVVDERGVRGGVVRVERDRLDRGRAERRAARRPGARALRVARREHDRAGPALHQLAQRRHRDVGATAEHQHRLHRTERVLHLRPLLLFLRGCGVDDHAGVTPKRGTTGGLGEGEAALQIGLQHALGVDARPERGEAVEVGVHHRHQLGAQARVLGEVDAPAGLGDELVETVEQRVEARARSRGCRARASSRAAGTTADRGCPGRSA